MPSKSDDTQEINKDNTTLLSRRVATLRIVFGVIWLVDAIFKFEPVFYRSLLSSIKATDSGEPHWLNHWFNFWYSVIGSNQHLFAVIIIASEALIAISLIFGLARRLNYILAFLFSFLIWGVGEAFGGPYVTGSTDVGAGIIYCVVFALLFAVDGLIKPSWALDNLLNNKLPWWNKVSSLKIGFKPRTLVARKVISDN